MRGVKAQEGLAPWLCLLVVLAAACLLFFARLRAPLLEPQEARYAEIPRQMLEAGRFLVPVLHGQDYLDKPPLLYWSVMAAYRVFGVSDWAARLVPALAGVLTVLVTFLWGTRALGLRAGLCGAVLLCLTPGFVYRCLLFHVFGWLWRAVRLQWDGAFFHETRALYFAGYIWGRRREEGRSLWSMPSEAVRFAGALFRRRARARPEARSAS